jgi:hypothetical protein
VAHKILPFFWCGIPPLCLITCHQQTDYFQTLSFFLSSTSSDPPKYTTKKKPLTAQAERQGLPLLLARECRIWRSSCLGRRFHCKSISWRGMCLVLLTSTSLPQEHQLPHPSLRSTVTLLLLACTKKTRKSKKATTGYVYFVCRLGLHISEFALIIKIILLLFGLLISKRRNCLCVHFSSSMSFDF